MHAKAYLHGAIELSTEHKGRPRKHPVWVLRYRLPSGKDSRKTPGRAWLKSSRPPAGLARPSARHLQRARPPHSPGRAGRRGT